MVCETNAMPQLHIKWLKNGDEVTPEDEKHEIRAQFSEGVSTLHFNSVSETDSGEYVCCGATSEKLTSYPNDCQMISKVATLDVAPGNWLLRPSPMVTYKPGQDVRIQCIPSDLQAQVHWRKISQPGFELRTNSRLDDRISVDSNNTLIIKTVASGDQGDYECSFAETKAVSYLTVLGKSAEFLCLPECTMSNYFNLDQGSHRVLPLEVFESESILAECPELKEDDTVQWFHQGKENAEFGSANLLITSANVSLFECLPRFFYQV